MELGIEIVYAIYPKNQHIGSTLAPLVHIKRADILPVENVKSKIVIPAYLVVTHM